MDSLPPHQSSPLGVLCVPACCRFSPVWFCAALWTVATRLLCPWDSPGKNAGAGCHALLQGIFPTQGSSPHLLHLLLWQASSLPEVPPGKPGCSVGLDKCVMTCIHHQCITQSNLEICSPLPSHPFPLAPGNHWSFYCLHSSAFPSMLWRWNHTVHSSLFRLTSHTL